MMHSQWHMVVTVETFTLFYVFQQKAIEASGSNENKVVFWDLYRRPIMRILSINMLFAWFTVSMVFYGLSLNGGALSG